MGGKVGKSSEYRKSESNGVTTFTVEPAPVPKFIFVAVLGAFAVLLGMSMLPVGVVLMALGGLAIWAGLMRDMRPKEHHGPSTFSAAADRIEAGGQIFQAGDIHRLIVRNAVTGEEADITILNPSTGVAAGMGYRAKVAKIANALTLESGGKATVLAGGMDEVTAYGLLQDVSKVVGFSRAA